jgi:hypothetical protein
MDFIDGKTDIMLPKDIRQNTLADESSVAGKFVANKISLVTVKSFTELGGKYRTVNRFIGSPDCGYVEDRVGLADQSDVLIIQPIWLDIDVLAEDRFIVTSGEHIDIFTRKAKIVDRNGAVLTGIEFNTLTFRYKGTAIRTGFGLVLPMSSTMKNEYYLLDVNGTRVGDVVWDDIKYFDEKTFEVEKGDQVYHLDLDGKVIPSM